MSGFDGLFAWLLGVMSGAVVVAGSGYMIVSDATFHLWFFCLLVGVLVEFQFYLAAELEEIRIIE